MPWTLAHPAAVLPLRRLCPRYLSLAGLVIGSMTPDIGYYVGRVELDAKTHSLGGIVEICLPVGLILLALVRFLHKPVARLLPAPHRGALLALAPPGNLLAPRMLGVAAASLLLGAFTHIAWDAFTHKNGYFVLHLAALQTPLFSLGLREFRAYHVLQHASTTAGIVLLAIAYSRFVRAHGGTGTRDNRRYTLLAMLGLISVACAVPLAYQDATHDGATEANVFVMSVHTLTYTTSAFAILLVAAALVSEYRRNT